MHAMRRKDKEMGDPAAMRKILATAKYVTVAMCRDGEPYLVSLSHGWDDGEDRIYFHCAGEGKKIDFLRANPVVWGQAIRDEGYAQGSCDHLFATVMFKGTVSFVEDADEKRRALEIMIRQLEDEPTKVLETQMQDAAIDRVTIGCIRVEHMTGKHASEVVISL